MGMGEPGESADADKFQGDFEVTVMAQGQAKKMRVSITRNDVYLTIDNIKLDFWDVDNSTTAPLLHMFVSADKKVDTDEKLKRMETWASTMGVYEREELVTMLQTGKIPRPINIVLRGSSRGLRRLYESLHFQSNPMQANEFIVPWNTLRDLASSGEFVSAWKKLKSVG